MVATIAHLSSPLTALSSTFTLAYHLVEWLVSHLIVFPRRFFLDPCPRRWSLSGVFLTYLEPFEENLERKTV
jgi:hypothetical protein